MSIALAQPSAAVTAAVETIRPFVPRSQLAVMLIGLGGEEGAFFEERILALANTIDSMPKTYEQDGVGDAAVVHLHYFMGAFDWWVTEKDMTGLGTQQAFGLADMGCPELGYICIDELLRVKGMQVDLHWQPTTLQAVWAGLGKVRS